MKVSSLPLLLTIVVTVIIVVCCQQQQLVAAIDVADAFVGGPPIRDLSDKDFEDVTQAGMKGGTTTGDWLLFFYAPWCGHCKHTMPVIEEFATKLYPAHGVQTARIDCNSVGTKTCRRFGVRAYPTIMFLKGGKLYSYDKYKRTSESLTGFAKDPVKSGAVAWREIPGELTWIDEVAYWGQLIRDDFTRLSGESPMVLYSLIGACGLLFLMILALAVSSPKVPEKTKKNKSSNSSNSKRSSSASSKKKHQYPNADQQQPSDKKND